MTLLWKVWSLLPEIYFVQWRFCKSYYLFSFRFCDLRFYKNDTKIEIFIVHFSFSPVICIDFFFFNFWKKANRLSCTLWTLWNNHQSIYLKFTSYGCVCFYLNNALLKKRKIVTIKAFITHFNFTEILFPIIVRNINMWMYDVMSCLWRLLDLIELYMLRLHN